jgi:hypothetical protein
MVSLLIAPIIVKFPAVGSDGKLNIVVVLVGLVLAAAIVWGILQSKKPAVELK